MKNIKVGLIDYGAGNLASVSKLIQFLNMKLVIINRALGLRSVDIVILPGVGNFKSAIQNLHTKNLIESIIEFKSKGNPIIGICLGMQMLATRSFESGETEGLNFISGDVTSIKPGVSHIGWNSIVTVEDNFFKKYNNKYFYFNHSYFFNAQDQHVISSSKFKKNNIASIIYDFNVLGFQFHPEKSQQNGKEILDDSIKFMLKYC